MTPLDKARAALALCEATAPAGEDAAVARYTLAVEQRAAKFHAREHLRAAFNEIERLTKALDAAVPLPAHYGCSDPSEFVPVHVAAFDRLTDVRHAYFTQTTAPEQATLGWGFPCAGCGCAETLCCCAPQPAHIAPPNWNTLCGLRPSPGLVAYDLCSLPADEAELDDPQEWCPACVAALRKVTP